MPRLKVEILVPIDHVEAVLDALHGAGAGAIGAYDHCVSLWPVTGRWRPLPGAQAYDGELGAVASGNEMKVESVCETSQAAAVTAAVRAVHPYEEPVMHFTALYDPETLRGDDPLT